MKKAAIVFFILLSAISYANEVIVQVVGEAVIQNNDIVAAKIEAESRAKWTAMETATRVKVSVGTMIHNAEMLDESVKTEISGSIVDFKLMDEGKDGNIYWMMAHVTVEQEKAESVINTMAMNSKIAVYLPMVMPDGTVRESHPFSENVVQELTGKGFEVMDLTSADDPTLAAQITDAASKNDMTRVRALASQYMAGSLLIGTVSVIDKGNNVGYANITFSIVDGSVTYRVIGVNQEGSKSVLRSGSINGNGQGATLTAAATTLSNNLSRQNASILASNVATTIMGENSKSVRVVLVGNNDMRRFTEFRDIVKNISWVLNVREAGVDTLILDYPEKTMYLATIINKNGGYKIKQFSDNEIQLYPR